MLPKDIQFQPVGPPVLVPCAAASRRFHAAVMKRAFIDVFGFIFHITSI